MEKRFRECLNIVIGKNETKIKPFSFILKFNPLNKLIKSTCLFFPRTTSHSKIVICCVLATWLAPGNIERNLLSMDNLFPCSISQAYDLFTWVLLGSF